MWDKETFSTELTYNFRKQENTFILFIENTQNIYPRKS